MTTAARAAASRAPAMGRLLRATGPSAGRGGATPYLFLAPFLVLFVGFVLAAGGVRHLDQPSRLRLPAARQAVRGAAELHRPLHLGLARLRATSGTRCEATGIFTVLSVPVPARPPARPGVAAQPGVPRPHVLPGRLLHPVRARRRGRRRPLPVHPRADDRGRELLPRPPAPPQPAWTTSTPWVWVTLVGVTVWWTMGSTRSSTWRDCRTSRPTSTRPPRSTGPTGGSSSGTSRCRVCGPCCSSC